MKNFQIYLIPVFTAFLFFSCTQKKQTKTVTQKAQPEINYRSTGREITGKAQDALFTHLGGAIRKGGVPFAVEYCNLKGITLVDSLDNTFNCTISRISEKSRNPQNALSGEVENTVWADFKKSDKKSGLRDTVINLNGNVIYYKAITIEMPTCLSCHGIPGSDIQPETLAKIDKLYHADKARNYEMNELRGLWKIEFNSGVK